MLPILYPIAIFVLMSVVSTLTYVFILRDELDDANRECDRLNAELNKVFGEPGPDTIVRITSDPSTRTLRIKAFERFHDDHDRIEISWQTKRTQTIKAPRQKSSRKR